MAGILKKDIEQYIRNLLPPRDELMLQIEQEAKDKIVPIVEPEIANLLYWLALFNESTRVLEIGTAIGYSTLWLARAVLPRGGKITTIEINEPRFLAAQKNLAKAGIQHGIELILGDARELLPQLKGPYDFIFLDAAKGKYPEFLQTCVDLLVPGGILAADNVFMHGMVISGEIDKRRNKTAVSRLQRFLKNVTAHPQLETIVLPLGDGITVSIKSRDK